jgi:hypothetical protein
LRRRFWVLGLLLTVLALGASIPWFFQTSRLDPIQYQNYDQLRPGMTRAEVEQVLGGRPGRYCTGPVKPFKPRITNTASYPPAEEFCEWEGDCDRICLGFDKDGRLCAMHGEWRERPSMWESIKLQFGS